jgi:RNA polymerase sigma-70 factor, ECF subfamily
MARNDPLTATKKQLPGTRLDPPPVSREVQRHKRPIARNASVISDDDAEQTLIERLRAGDVQAFSSLVDRYHRLLMHVCSAYVSSRSIAEEVVQETWMAVIEGLDAFQGRSSLRSWICSIAINRARMRRRKDRRMVSFSALDPSNADEAAVDAATTLDPRHPSGQIWDERTPEVLLASAETGQALASAVEDLPPSMRLVLVLRDIEGLTAGETCRILNITEANQRVLLHRARMRLRNALVAIHRG